MTNAVAGLLFTDEILKSSWLRALEALAVVLMLAPFLLIQQVLHSSNPLYFGAVGAMYAAALLIWWYVRRKWSSVNPSI